MYIEQQLNHWEQFYNSSLANLKYPNEAVIRFIKGNFKVNSNILDLGCGSGRHVLFLAEEGYSVSGIDFSSTAISNVRTALQQNSLQAELITGSIVSLPFESETFDGVISFAVMYYFVVEDIKKIIAEIYRVLKPNGKAFIVVRGTEDMRYGKGQEVERNTYKLSTNFSNEEGMLMHFFERNELLTLFSSFSNIEIGFNRESVYHIEQCNYDYLLTVTK